MEHLHQFNVPIELMIISHNSNIINGLDALKQHSIAVFILVECFFFFVDMNKMRKTFRVVFAIVMQRILLKIHMFTIHSKSYNGFQSFLQQQPSKEFAKKCLQNCSQISVVFSLYFEQKECDTLNLCNFEQLELFCVLNYYSKS